MDVAEFWDFIEESHRLSNGVISTQISVLLDQLQKLSSNEILAFEKILKEANLEAHKANLWDAAAIIACGCSDDVFDDFCYWLIAQGKNVFESTIINPDILADKINDREAALDGRLLAVAQEAYLLKTGNEMPLVDYSRKKTLIGEFIPDEDIKNEYPMLYEKFGNCDDD
ncbi:MAG TPA: DUF4240 domain-containing protein [Phototrophicaceae bacterium]|nr:DUF4240 domain-containing protein [Phototrophicaceae bacterium]